MYEKLTQISDLLPNMNFDFTNRIPDVAIRNTTFADYQYEIICDYIKEFQDSLDDDHEVAIQLTSFGQSILLNVTKIGYSNPCLLHFDGFVEGKKAHLIQHVSQINFLILSARKENPTKPPRRIGFDLPTNE